MSTTGAVLSDDGLYRYELTRSWGSGRRMVVAMLNPSTADATEDDPTIRRCVGFARREGCGSLVVVNLYALRATHPEHLLDHPDPEGPENPAHWARALADPGDDLLLAAWGAGRPAEAPGSLAMERWAGTVPWLCLGTTASGHPRHPLFVRAEKALEPW